MTVSKADRNKPRAVVCQLGASAVAGKRQEAANHYVSYLERVRQGKAAEYAYGRLQGWGYLK